MHPRARLRRRQLPKNSGKSRQVIAEALEPRRLLAADVVISEFMASNSKTLKDAAGNYEDWIEIHNAGDTAANLSDYFLTDNAGDPEEWRFPAQSLAAGAYLVVFADNTSATPVPNTELHTNFKLSADGEYLGLINEADDSVAFEYAPQFPAQTADVSYGLSDSNDPNSARVYFSVATPGAANSPSVATPVFSVQGQVFTGTLAVSLSDPAPDAVIHYTLDGSTPTTSSPTYTTPFSLTTSKEIRAIATASGYTSSPITSQTYERVDSSVLSVQNTNLPIVIIDTYGATMNDTTHIAASATFMNTTDGSTNLLGTADYQGRVGIHIRGSTSEGYAKQQYSIELWDENNGDKKVSLFGMPADSDWVLYDPYTELSLMQNQLAYQWANETGHYASKTQFVEVYMSTGGNSYAGNTTTINYSSNYMGVYILEEKVKADSNRVDVGNEISTSNPNGGYIVAQDRYSGTTYFTTPQGVNIVLDDPDDSSVRSLVATNWDAFENALFTGSAGANQPWDTPGNPNYYGNYIDINSFVDYFLINEMTRNIDSFWLSTFYNKAADTVVNGVVTQRGLISAGPVWDFNLALGAANYNFSADSEGWDTNTLSPAPGAAGVSGFDPQDAYFQRLLTDPNFVQAVSDRWNQLRQGVFSTSQLMSDIDADVQLLSASTGVYPVGINPSGTTSPVMRNFQKWPELGVYVVTDGMYDPAGSWIQDVNLMKNWLTGRINWMDSQFQPTPITTPGGDYTDPVSVSMTPVAPATTTDVQLIGPGSTIYYKVPTGNISDWQTLSATSQPSGWSTGTTGLGYDTTTSPVNFLPYISTNLQSQMFNKRADVFTLMNFTITDPSQIEALILKVQYDDGFTAWINGVRVMDANSPENKNPVYNTNAAGSGDDTQAILYREFDVTSIKSLLHVGNNTLAIQGMNSGSGSEDFLLSPTLYARTYNYAHTGTVYYTMDGSDPRGTNGLPTGAALVYGGALALNSNTEIKARTYAGGVWSALSDQVYDFTANSLRITELMYNPPAGSGYTTQDYEYVEVKNVSNSPLDLSGYQFSDAIVFSFPDTILAPGAYGVIVKNPAAFTARYGTSANILGTYSGSFDNSGEHVAITDALGQTVEEFTYDPTWYSQTDGGGASLVVVDPTGDTSTLESTAGWRASYTQDGAPGFADSDAIIPAISSWSVHDGGTGQPTIQFVFNTYLSEASTGSLTLIDSITGQPVSVVGHSIDGNTLTFLLNSTLASGAYQLTLPAGAVVNASNIANSTTTTDTFILIRQGTTWAIPSTGPGLIVNALSLGTGAKLDIGSGSLLVDYTGATPAGAIRQFLYSGRANGAWNGAGIDSSAAAANANHEIAYAEASDLGLSTFAGQTIDSTAILLKYTLAGDANLDGRLNGDDFALADRGRAKGLGIWVFGDFDYDGVVTAADLSILNASLAALSAPPAPTVAVPSDPAPADTSDSSASANASSDSSTPAENQSTTPPAPTIQAPPSITTPTVSTPTTPAASETTTTPPVSAPTTVTTTPATSSVPKTSTTSTPTTKKKKTKVTPAPKPKRTPKSKAKSHAKAAPKVTAKAAKKKLASKSAAKSDSELVVTQMLQLARFSTLQIIAPLND